MFFTIITMMLMLLAWKITRSLTITSTLSIVWCYTIPPFAFWLGSWVSWGVMWELSSLDLISSTTEQCNRKNGGTIEMWPTRLGYNDWLIHHGCVGREEGYSHPIYGNLVLLALPLVIMASAQIVMMISKNIPYLNSFCHYLQTFFSLMAGIIAFLAELFVVTKPVELSEGVLVDKVTYDHLVYENDQMRKTILDLSAKLNDLELIVELCATFHANPDATTMKVQQDQLAISQQQHDRLRREYVELQNRCQILKDRQEDVRFTNVGALRNTINSQESEIIALKNNITSQESEIIACKNTINVLAARPDAEQLKAEKKRAKELQQRLDACIQEATLAEINAGLKKEELEKLQTSNKSLLSESKAAEARAQVVASAHKKAMEEMTTKMEEAEAAAFGLQYQLESIAPLE